MYFTYIYTFCKYVSTVIHWYTKQQKFSLFTVSYPVPYVLYKKKNIYAYYTSVVQFLL